ncbi:TonB-dependent receptor [Duganella sp. P38]|uniref:TonB-dependent receptor n=1 Tax=Duganella sp. P38 TaxID=3423949 RepID=UPI003D79EA7D
MKRLLLLAALPSLAVAAPVIPAGSLDQVLRAYTLASGVLLSADGRLTLDVRSPGLAEVSGPERDLPRMLNGTRLEAVRAADGSYLLRVAAPAPPVEVLPEVVARPPAPAPFDTVSSFAVQGGAALRDIPQALSVVGSAQMRERGLQSMAELLAYVPGAQATLGEGNRDSAVFRGYNTSADFYLDGMRDDVQYYRDFYNTEAVEVLKGPNAMALGRGGSGGSINRVSKQAQWRDIGNAELQLGAWRERRASVDVGAALTPRLAWRLNAVDESSASYRDGVWLKRYGISPSLAWLDGDGTRLQLNYEHFHDRRSSDRGVPSYRGRPVAADPSTFFGDAGNSYNSIDIDGITLRVERQFTPSFKMSSQLHYAVYDKFYQNVFAGAVQDDGATVMLLAYQRSTRRANLLYQGELETLATTGAVRHRLSAGLELGRVRNDNVRASGYFDTLGQDTLYAYVPVTRPSIHLPQGFRPAAGDAQNASRAENVSLYLQDQMTLSPQWQVLAGLRAEAVNVALRDIRDARQLASRDRPVAPRLGLTYRPVSPESPLSLYASVSKTYVLRAGEQLTSLTVANQSLAPEVVRSHELGARWEDGDRLSASVAVYQLRRGNVLVDDPLRAGDAVLAEGQRGSGLELEAAGRVSRDWTLNLGYAWQRSRLTATQSATSQSGARMPHTPRQTLSLWSSHTLRPGFEAALGVIARASMYTSTSNAVVLPGYARLDGTLAWQPAQRHRVQLRIENLLNRRYFASAYSDNNIMPGAPRAVRVTLTSRF